MIRHVVMVTFVADATPEQRQAAHDAIARLPSLIPEIRQYSLGFDAGLMEGNYDLVVVGDFDDEDAYLTYAQHPDHVAALAEHVRPILADRSAVQYRL